MPKRTRKAIRQDKTIKAKHAGKRKSADGNIYYENRPNRSDVNRTFKFFKGGDIGNVRTLESKFNKEKPAIALYVIADTVADSFIIDKHKKTIVWEKLTDSEKEKYNEDYKKNKAAFEKHLVHSFLKLYYSDKKINEKCSGQSRRTIHAINSVMKSIAKKYDASKYENGGGVEIESEIVHNKNRDWRLKQAYSLIANEKEVKQDSSAMDLFNWANRNGYLVRNADEFNHIANTISPRELEKHTNKFNNGGGVEIEEEYNPENDLFAKMETLPDDVREVLDRYSEEDPTYESLGAMLKELEPLGYTFEYYLDAEPFNLRKITHVKGGGIKRDYREFSDKPKNYKYREYSIQDLLISSADVDGLHGVAFAGSKGSVKQKLLVKKINEEARNLYSAFKEGYEKNNYTKVNKIHSEISHKLDDIKSTSLWKDVYKNESKLIDEFLRAQPDDEMSKGGGVGEPEHYRYVTIQKVNGGLKISLNEEGIEEIKDLKDDDKSDLDIWAELFEDVQGNSEYIFHSDMGNSGFGLTSAEGITDGYYYEGEDRDNLYKTDYPESAKVYWFPNYMVESPLETMIENGNVVFTEAESMAIEMAKGGEVNSKYLDTISDDKKSKILKNIANHYGVSVADAEQEVKDEDAEMLYEYIANDQSLRMDVYNDFKRNKYAKGGGIGNENAQMVLNNVKQIEHHAKELYNVLKGIKHVPAWVVSKVYRSASDLSDATHYLDGEKNKMANGGGVSEDRMYNFLVDDLVKLEKAISENDKEEIDRFFSYWSYHLKSLAPKKGSDRMYNFLKDDLVKLEKAINENDKEEIDRFFSYWNTHLKSLKYSKGGGIDIDRVDNILKHYVIAALWSSTDDDGDALDSLYSFDDVDSNTLTKMRVDIAKFINENDEAIKESGMTDEQLGHDLWLTRNGHGAGFWDRGYEKEIGDKLSDAARAMKGTDLYVGDDNKVHAEKSSYAKGGGVGDTIADRYARLTETEAKRLDELQKKVRINEQTESEDAEFDRLVDKYRGWDKYAKGGGFESIKMIREGFAPIKYDEAKEMYEDYKNNFGSSIKRYTAHQNKVHNSRITENKMKKIIEFGSSKK